MPESGFPFARKLRGAVTAQRLRGWPLPMAILAVGARSISWRGRIALYRTQLPQRWRSRPPLVPRIVRLLWLRLRCRLQPDAASAHEALGHALASSGRWGDAVPQWERALELDPERFELYEACATTYHHQGRVDDVLRMQRQGVEVQARLARERQVDRFGFRVLHHGFTNVIGHMCELDVLIKQLLLDGRSTDELQVLAARRNAVNQAYLDYWMRYFPTAVFNSTVVGELAWMIRLLRTPWLAWRDSAGRLGHYYAVAREVQARWEAEGRPPLLSLSEDERERGRARLEALGVPADAWFVTLHVREDRADKRFISRNAKIGDYRRAIEAVVERGGWVIRMGGPEMTRLPPIEGAVDYALSDAKSDWMDVFLWAEGRFLVASDSGPLGVPQTFGKPVLMTNRPLGYGYWYAGDIFLPRLYRSERERRLLTFREALRSPVSLALLDEEMARHGVRLRSNTPDEIEEAVVEMLEQLDGTPAVPDAEVLRQRYELIETPWLNPLPHGGARIGHGFLRRHADLLDEVPESATAE